MVLATDGIDSRLRAARSRPAARRRTIADRILGEHGKATDDALVVVVRYLPAE